MRPRVIYTPDDIDRLCRFLHAQPMPMTVSARKGAKRSHPQNATVHAWFGQIAAETGQTAAEVKAECKLRYGLPIMAAECHAWVAEWEGCYRALPYHAQVKLFELLPMTSKMTTRQMSAFMDAVQKEYRAQGIDLIDPEARKYEAEMMDGSQR